jgi:hypothetical protein
MKKAVFCRVATSLRPAQSTSATITEFASFERRLTLRLLAIQATLDAVLFILLKLT